jgi:hypothetical protein
MEHQFVSPTSTSTTPEHLREREEERTTRMKNGQGAVRRFASNHPWVVLGTALGLGFAFGLERQRIWSGTRRLGSTCRDAGVGAWHGALERIRG